MLELNLKNNAVTQTSVSFNSMCKFGNVALGCNSSGLYQITGYNDHGIEINALMQSGTTDFGVPNQKRFRSIHATGEANGDCKLSLYADGELACELDIVPDNTGVFDVKVPVSHVHVGRWWSWSFENVDGAFFALYSVSAVITVLHSCRNRG